MLASACRACAAPSSKRPTNWAAESMVAGLKLPLEKSSSGVVRTATPKLGSCATCGASRPKGMDLGCGTKSGLSAGTRSKVTRVFITSSSNSVNNRSLMGMRSPFKSRLLLRALVKRYWNHLALYGLVPNFHGNFGIDCRQLARHVGQRNVFLQKRSIRSARDVANFLAAGVEDFVTVAGNAALDRLQAHQR